MIDGVFKKLKYTDRTFFSKKIMNKMIISLKSKSSNQFPIIKNNSFNNYKIEAFLLKKIIKMNLQKA